MFGVLNVYLKSRFCGQLSWESERNRYEFRYDRAYLDDPLSERLSFSLPLQAEPFDEDRSYRYFANLLPPEVVRRKLEKCLHVSRNNVFGFLKAIGGDCAGAVALYPPGVHPNLGGEERLRELDEDEANYMNERPNMHATFEVGNNYMNGWQALNYVRMRHSSAADNDFKRTERQRKVISQFVNMISDMSLADLNDMVDEILPLVKTDIEPSRIMDYILEVAPLLTSLKVETQQIPVEGSAHGEIRDIYGDGMESAVLIPDIEWNKRVLMEICEEAGNP